MAGEDLSLLLAGKLRFGTERVGAKDPLQRIAVLVAQRFEARIGDVAPGAEDIVVQRELDRRRLLRGAETERSVPGHADRHARSVAGRRTSLQAVFVYKSRAPRPLAERAGERRPRAGPGQRSLKRKGFSIWIRACCPRAIPGAKRQCSSQVRTASTRIGGASLF